MGTTSYGTNDALAVKLWGRTLDVEALKYSDIAALMGKSPGSIIQVKSEFRKGPGDRLTFGLRMQLNGEGFSENDLAEGNGEELTTYSDSLSINELGNVVGVKSQYTIDQQRVPFNLRVEAKDGLRDWYAKRFSVEFFNQVCGITTQTNIKYTGLNPTVAATRILRQNGKSDDASLTTGDEFALNMIDNAKELATTATPPLRPVNVPGFTNGRRDFNKTLTDKFVVYLHPYQVTDIRTNTSTGQWLDLEKAASQGRGHGNRIYDGSIGEYNSCIMRSSYDVPLGVSNAGANVATARRGVLLGGQAAVMGFGREGGDVERFRWNEEMFDHKRRLEVSAWTIHGLKKTAFNSLDYGVVVLSSFAAAHTS
jgi:N4-gp56 family major capsid protein